jgi:hypothetical protein
MIGSSISARPSRARNKASISATCAAAAVLMLLAPAARAQNLFFLFEPAPHRIERQLESAGYELRSPLVRRGDVYVADVMGQMGARERLIIDARTARIVDRFPSVATRGREDRFGDWRDRDDEDAWGDAPRPPQGLAPRPHDDAWGDANDDSAPAPRPKPHDEVARTDPSAKPNIIYGEDGINGPATSTVDVDKSKPKPHVAKKKPAPAALAKATASVPPSTDGIPPLPPPNPNPLAAESPKPVSPSVQVETPARAGEGKAPVDAKPVAEAKPSTTETKPSTTETKPVEAKPVAETNKPVAEAKAAPPPPRSPEKKLKAVNDVPVNPLD